MKKTNKILIPLISGLAIATTVATPLLASCASNSNEVSVTLTESAHVTIDATKATKNAELTINVKANDGYVLGRLAIISVGDNLLDVLLGDYTFTVDRNDNTKGVITIAANKITDNITIAIRAVQNVQNLFKTQEIIGLKTLTGFSDEFLALPALDRAALLGYELTIPSDIEGIGENAFYESSGSSGTSYRSTLPDTVSMLSFDEGSQCTFIGKSAFRNSNLNMVLFPKDLQAIGETAFYGCSKLLSAHLPEGLQIINKSAFNGCSALININIPYTVDIIGQNAFYGCASLKNIWIDRVIDEWMESSDVNYDKTAFSGIGDGAEGRKLYVKTHYTAICIKAVCSDLIGWETVVMGQMDYVKIFDFEVEQSEGVVVKGFKQSFLNLNPEEQQSLVGHDKCLTIPSFVTSIADNAFNNKLPTWVRTLDFDVDPKIILETKGCENIGEYAFANNTSLETLYLPTTLATLKKGAFKGCSTINYIYIAPIGDEVPEQWATTGDHPFDGADQGTVVVNDMSGIDTWKAYFTRGVTESKFNDWQFSVSQTKIFEMDENYEITGFTAAWKTLSEDVQHAILFAISGSTTTLLIPAEAKSTSKGLLKDKTSLPDFVTTVKFEDTTDNPSQLTLIGQTFLNGRTNIENVILPENAAGVEIGKSAFNGCKGLTSIKLPKSITKLNNNVFFECSNLDEIDISGLDLSSGFPWDATAAQQSFWGVKSTGVIIIPKGLTTAQKESIKAFFVATSKQTGSTTSRIDFDSGNWQLQEAE